MPGVNVNAFTGATGDTVLIKSSLGEPLVLLAETEYSTAETVTADWVRAPDGAAACELFLCVSAAADAAGDTLDVVVQADLGNTAVDVCYFTQVLGNGGAKHITAKIAAETAETMFANTDLTADNIRNLLGPRYRVKHTIADSGGHGQAFTFSVGIIPLGGRA